MKYSRAGEKVEKKEKRKEKHANNENDRTKASRDRWKGFYGYGDHNAKKKKLDAMTANEWFAYFAFTTMTAIWKSTDVRPMTELRQP